MHQIKGFGGQAAIPPRNVVSSALKMALSPELVVADVIWPID
jgi:hypothetical protein